ncbi:hypothetical protein [Puniceicoccus vermicola]|uniref:PEP-CTERM sorting domain-containing protein n=1 Tax=Puniceicoccus vermicola TaxID=388746 RepID=A0A7X1E7E7_9BACT|nr:hypothetical protein [Puniceicoccus vermicola]MBC2603652.1 hypothetical protein [Puniceicoccus vermicola]
MKKKLSLVRCLVVAPVLPTLTASSLLAGTVFSDDFTGVDPGAPSEKQSTGLNDYGYFFYNGNEGGYPWTVGTDNNSPLSGDVLRNQGAQATNTYTYRQFGEVSLTNVGDSISLTLDYNPNGATSGNLTIALLNSETTITANSFGGSSLTPDGDGYMFHQVISGSDTSPNYYDVVNDSSYFNAANIIHTPSETATIGGPADGKTFSLTLTKTVLGVQIDASIAGTTFSSFEDTTGDIYTSFNTMRIRSASGFNFDNITLSSVPEPAAGAMILAMLAGVFCLRRRNFLRSNRVTG